MGMLKYVPTNAYPYEATALVQGRNAFFGPDLVLNQVPKINVLLGERHFPAERKVTPLGPIYVLKGVDVGVEVGEGALTGR